MKTTEGPKIGELFAGYGGLGMGVQAALGGEIAWVSEYDKGPSKILAHRFPGVPNHGDITKIDWSQVEPVDILTGGSPCQDLSHAGARKGMTEGTRSNLWVAMREAIAQLKPGLVVWENVGGAFSANADSEVEPCAGCVGDGSGPVLRALGRVLGDLASLGFDAEWTALRAADVGAPHGRLRVFVVAYPAGDQGRLQHGDGGLAAVASGLRRGAGWSSVAGEEEAGRASTHLAGRSDAPLTRAQVFAGDWGDWPGEDVTTLPTPTARDWKDHTIRREPHRPDDMDTLARALTVTLLPTPRAGDGEKGGPNQRGSSGDFMLPSAVTHIEARLLPTPRTQNNENRQSEGYGGKDGNFHGLVNGLTSWGQYAAAIQRWESLTRPAPAPTELGPKGNPRLSAAFSEWMMGLPAGWITDVPGITRNEALKACGNGVVPQQCAAAVRWLWQYVPASVRASLLGVAA